MFINIDYASGGDHKTCFATSQSVLLSKGSHYGNGRDPLFGRVLWGLRIWDPEVYYGQLGKSTNLVRSRERKMGYFPW